jgi:hypothetical protein
MRSTQLPIVGASYAVRGLTLRWPYSIRDGRRAHGTDTVPCKASQGDIHSVVLSCYKEIVAKSGELS